MEKRSELLPHGCVGPMLAQDVRRVRVAAEEMDVKNPKILDSHLLQLLGGREGFPNGK